MSKLFTLFKGVCLAQSSPRQASLLCRAWSILRRPLVFTKVRPQPKESKGEDARKEGKMTELKKITRQGLITYLGWPCCRGNNFGCIPCCWSRTEIHSASLACSSQNRYCFVSREGQMIGHRLHVLRVRRVHRPHRCPLQRPSSFCRERKRF